MKSHEGIDIVAKNANLPRINFNHKVKVYITPIPDTEAEVEFKLYTTSRRMFTAFGTYQGRDIYDVDSAASTRDFKIIANALDSPTVPVFLEEPDNTFAWNPEVKYYAEYNNDYEEDYDDYDYDDYDR